MKVYKNSIRFLLAGFAVLVLFSCAAQAIPDPCLAILYDDFEGRDPCDNEEDMGALLRDSNAVTGQRWYDGNEAQAVGQPGNRFEVYCGVEIGTEGLETCTDSNGAGLPFVGSGKPAVSASVDMGEALTGTIHMEYDAKLGRMSSYASMWLREHSDDDANDPILRVWVRNNGDIEIVGPNRAPRGGLIWPVGNVGTVVQGYRNIHLEVELDLVTKVGLCTATDLYYDPCDPCDPCEISRAFDWMVDYAPNTAVLLVGAAAPDWNVPYTGPNDPCGTGSSGVDNLWIGPGPGPGDVNVVLDCAYLIANLMTQRADINLDCKVDFYDFAEIAKAWHECTDPNKLNCP